MIFLKILATLIFNGISFTQMLTNSLFMAGLWKILVKCGLPGYYAVIPGWSYYSMGRCADREREGRVLFVADALGRVLNVGMLFLKPDDNFTLLQTAFVLALFMVELIYYLQVVLGLLEVFGRRKRWTFLWVLSDYLSALIFGFGKSFQPQWKVPEMEHQDAEFFSGAHAEVMANGLTVNLEERTVTDFFQKKYLLRDIHMVMEPGKMVLLLGGSGAGKTTLVNAINGYEKAKAEVFLNGKNLYTDYKHMQYEVGFVPQQDLMRGNDTVLNTLLDAAALRLPVSLEKSEREARVNEVMDIFGLSPVKNNLVEKLSGGQRKRLSIAMEFISNPSLFILDEPDSGLDGVMARELMQQLRSIADQGKIIIVITHTPDRVIDLFDSVIVLAKDTNRTGRLAFYGSIADARAFFGKDSMEGIVRSINRKEEGGEGRADEFILKYTEVQHA